MPNRIKDLTNLQFGRLLVICLTKKRRYGGAVWLCRCICGNLVEIRSGGLHDGQTKSCGCLQKEGASRRRKAEILHGDCGTSLYYTWKAMKSRCFNPHDKVYRRYGGRGITVCGEWKSDYPTFKKWATANGHQDNLTIDRINNDGNYEPNNCQFLTRSENSKKGLR